MPQLFRIGSYIVFFWANENSPLEPLHIHIAEGKPTETATKVWITETGRCLVAHNRSHIPNTILNHILRLAEANCEEIRTAWLNMFGEISYIC